MILFLASVLLRVSSREGALLRVGAVYIATVYVVYLLSGLGLVWFQHYLIERGLAAGVSIGVGILVIALGLIELKDVFFYGRGISLEIAPHHRERLVRMAERLSFGGVVAIGGFVALVELPCTGGPYLAITTLLARSFDAGAFAYLLLYNAVFVLPLVAILLLLQLGTSTLALKRWRQSRRKWMNLATGTLMIALGVFLIASRGLGSLEPASALARCLTQRGVVVYTSTFCGACRWQRDAFGEGYARIREVECHPHAPDAQPELCMERNIRVTPTWVRERDGEELARLEGARELKELAAFSECAY